jgi:hypothetical protein
MIKLKIDETFATLIIILWAIKPAWFFRLGDRPVRDLFWPGFAKVAGADLLN